MEQGVYPGYLPLMPGSGGRIHAGETAPIRVNGHIHTPYSFSAFSGLEQIFRMAREEGVSVLGINDFNTTGGYREFAELAWKNKVFPLFNIEFMALQKEEQKKGIRINDPVNPGRTYLSGKGLCYPVSMSRENSNRLETLLQESNLQTRKMVDRLNGYLAGISAGMSFDAGEIKRRLARKMLRERHIAAAIRLALFEKWEDEETVRKQLTLIFGGKVPKFPSGNMAFLENEIRGNLLKAGGPAYVPEDEKAFLSLVEVKSLITGAGGIPCYPVLLDDAGGNFTDYEKDWENLASDLAEKDIYMVELIPGRNDLRILKDFVTCFRSFGFTVLLGTEHNTPELEPLVVRARGGVPLDEELLRINEEGGAIVAAHQYLTANGQPGFPTGHFPDAAELQALQSTGKEVILRFIKQ